MPVPTATHESETKAALRRWLRATDFPEDTDIEAEIARHQRERTSEWAAAEVVAANR